ncbi:MAG: hypothetical protein EP146_17235 [Oscillibacter sp.]|nr:hypothetical protein [Oscillibacter sp.]
MGPGGPGPAGPLAERRGRRTEPAAKLDIQWELDSQADITVSFLESCGIPAFQNGSLGKVLGGFASQGVEIWVPASQLEEAQALLDTPAEIPEQD